MPARLLTFVILFTITGETSLVSFDVYAQPTERVLRFFDDSGQIRVHAEVVWGTLHVIGHERDDVRLSVSHVREGGSPRSVADIDEYVTVESQNNAYWIRGRRPSDATFESINLTLFIPSRADISLQVSRGGEVIVEDMDGLVEVSQRNGSVVLNNLGGAALVNALNGSIEASFRAVKRGEAMSFIALNGEIDLTFPRGYRADLRLRSERNGYVTSEFALPNVDYPYADEPRDGTAKPLHSRQPIEFMSRINGGGPVLIATTENGPIRIRRGAR